MYLASVNYFVGLMQSHVHEASEREGSVRESILAIYETLIELYLSGNDGAWGCLVVCTAATEAAGNEKIRKTLEAVFQGIDKRFEQQLVLAQKTGGLSPSSDPPMLASVLGGVAHTLAVRPRAGAPRATLRKLARSAVELVFQG